MASLSTLLTPGFLLINLLFVLVISISASFFAFADWLRQIGMDPSMAGFIISADALAALIVQPLITPLMHSGNARRWLLGGSLLLAAALFAIGHAPSIALLTAARLAQGAGFICVLTALITLVIPFIPQEMSGRAFGYISLVRLIPYAVIPLLFNLPAVAAHPFSSVLVVTAVTALLPALALMLPAIKCSAAGHMTAPPGMKGLAASLRSRPVVMLLLSCLLFFCSYSVIFFYLKQFAPTIGISRPGVFFTAATLVMIAVRLFCSAMFDRYDKFRLSAAGLFCSACCYALLPLCASETQFHLLAIFTGLGWGIAMPLQAAAMFDISTPQTRAMNQNLMIIMMQGGFFLGPLAAGQLIQQYGFGLLFMGLAITTLLSAALMAAITPPAKEDAACQK